MSIRSCMVSLHLVRRLCRPGFSVRPSRTGWDSHSTAGGRGLDLNKKREKKRTRSWGGSTQKKKTTSPSTQLCVVFRRPSANDSGGLAPRDQAPTAVRVLPLPAPRRAVSEAGSRPGRPAMATLEPGCKRGCRPYIWRSSVDIPGVWVVVQGGCGWDPVQPGRRGVQRTMTTDRAGRGTTRAAQVFVPEH